MTVKITVPDGSSLLDAVNFGVGVSELPDAQEYQFDFSNVKFVTPAWLILVGDALKHFRATQPDSKKEAVGYNHLRYAAHAGFFKHFGVQFGLESGSANTTENFIPITTESVDDIKAEAADRMEHHGDYLQSQAEEFSSVLLQLETGAVFETLSYSIREIVRNVIEHSGSENYSFAAQFWPSRQCAELVVSDQGMGLKQSLKSNPKYSVDDDTSAIKLAVSPGISSKVGRRQREKGPWRNSGYGLFMTKQLCAETGSFGIISGNAACIWNEGSLTETKSALIGTTVTMTLQTSNQMALGDRLETIRDSISQFPVPKIGKPSTASLGAMSKKDD